MKKWFQLRDVRVDVIRKDIKNLHLSVLPPVGRVRIAAPERMSLDAVRVFAIEKLPWIRRQQRKLREQVREAQREHIDRESHYVWGQRYLLELIEADQTPSVEVSHNRLVLRVRPGTDASRRQDILEEWYREQLRATARPIIEKWQRIMLVEVRHLFVQRMKTKWGGCNHCAGSIRPQHGSSQKTKGVSRIHHRP